MVPAGPFHLQPHLTMLDGKGLVLTPCMSGLSFLARKSVVWLDQPQRSPVCFNPLVLPGVREGTQGGEP